LGRLSEAGALYQRSLSIAEKALGADDPAVGRVLNDLAELYEEQGHLSEAERLMKRTLGILERRWVPNTPTLHVHSTAWPGCTAIKAASPRLSR
jgi:hypothetical protein